MENICPVCEQPITLLKRCKLKDGVVCKSCFENSGLKDAGFIPIFTETWEVCVLHEMTVNEKLTHFEKKRKELENNEAAAQARLDEINQQPPANKELTCKICGSASLSANKEGFGIGKAVVGSALFGNIGLVAGNIGAKNVRITCLNCGHNWLAGKDNKAKALRISKKIV